MNHIIIASHSTLAKGLYEATKFFQSELDNVHYINAYVDHPDFEKEFIETLESLKHKNVIVFTDILGGSVNQVAMRHLPSYGYHLVSGTNLAVLLETVFKNEDIGDEEMRQIVEAGKQQLTYVNDMLMAIDEEDEED